MKIFKTVLIVVVGLILGLAVIGFLLPGHVHVARSTLIKAPAAQILIYLDDYSRFNDWSPWKELDAETTYVFSGPERGVGAHMEWHSNKPDVGSGKQTVLAVDGDRQVRWSVEFGGRGVSEMTFDLVPEAAGTRLTWNIDMDMGMNPIARWAGLMLDGAIGPDFEKGLSRLKALTEKGALAPITPADMAEPSIMDSPAAEETPAPATP